MPDRHHALHYPALVLASASPRRRLLLESACLRVRIVPARIDERPHPGETPVCTAIRLAAAKANAVLGRLTEGPGDDLEFPPPILAADTVVHTGGRIFDKPRDPEEACEVLAALAGRWHDVTTGFCITWRDEQLQEHVTTRVRLRHLSREEISRYVETGEPMDKAGAYGIQGRGGTLVDRVEGSYTNVVGLPLAEVLERLAELGLEGCARQGAGAPTSRT